MDGTGQVASALTVGQLADLVGTTVRTLHHYDRIGLLVPSERTTSGYRLYTEEDVVRLRNVVVYRRVGFRWRRPLGSWTTPAPTSWTTCGGSAPP